MCGRYRLKSEAGQFLEELQHIRITPNLKLELRPRYNICPTQTAPVIFSQEGSRMMELFRWGLLPPWAKDKKLAPINAKAEGVDEKPMFRAAFKRRRCLVPADGFYEWQKRGAVKQPMSIHFRDGRTFTFAGLWEERKEEDGSVLRTFTLLTTSANARVKDIHDRMPVILPRDAQGLWLDEQTPKDVLLQLLQPHAPDEMETLAISTLINSPKNDTPEVLAPAPAELF